MISIKNRDVKDGFNPPPSALGPRHRRPFQRGDFKYILLQHLKEKPSYGYEIIRAVEERFHGFYVPSPGSVYPTLQMLEEMGHVTSAEKDGKKVYSITHEGLQFLEEEKESQKRIKEQTTKWWNPENADDIIKTMHELDKLGGLLRDKVRNADADKISRMRKALSQACEEVAKI
ncbi:MAG: PadR family transcriptional regulator [Dehalococcoidales bacterium]|nr:PadR family transcriptional regulator [Dehalococcoidales bacterium]